MYREIEKCIVKGLSIKGDDSYRKEDGKGLFDCTTII